MKKTKTMKIQLDEKTEKEFIVKELTVAQIIDLSQNNPLFGATLNDAEENTGKGTESASEGGDILKDMMGFSKSAKKVMELSCDFKFKDLKPLTPSDVDTLYLGWKEVNQTFLQFLERMGILGVAKEILEKAISDFSRTLAI